MTTSTFRKRLLASQMEIKAIKKTAANDHFRSKYFDINELLAEVKPILNKHGILLQQPLGTHEGKLCLNTRLLDTESDEVLEYYCPLPEILSPVKSDKDGGMVLMPDPQKTGSAITYFRRYALQAMLALEAEDDDGNNASGKKAEKKAINNDEPPF